MNARVDIGGHAFELRDLARADRDALIALHREVFGEGATPAWYAWKYEAGQGLGTGLWHEGRLVAHCGGLPRALWAGGARRSGIQIGDVMVAPQWRGLLTRRGPFQQVSQAFYEGHVGAGTPHDIAFGFPSERHLRLAVKSKLLWDGGPVQALSWTTADAPPLSQASGWSWKWDALAADGAAFDPAARDAWNAMRRACTDHVVGERTPEYLRWRFFRRPGRTHAAFVLRRAWSRRARGIAILDLAQPAAQWLDWIGTPQDLPRACAFVRAQARAAGAAHVGLWATPAVAKSLAASGIARNEVTAWIGIPRRSAFAEADIGRHAWWLLGGDTDFL